MHRSPVVTRRLELRPFTASAIDALLAGNGSRLAALTAATFPAPLAPPPLTEGLLPIMRDRQRQDPRQEGWWGWLVIVRATRDVAGSLVFGGPPDADGTVVLGYATYPAFVGNGYATEAARALIEWALAQPSVRRVCATIPQSNSTARRVAAKLGMQPMGRWWDPATWDDDVDDVILYGLERGGLNRRSD